jgi:MoaA/NifB/PqqE/SkfB family radical SAM enzyme
MSIETVKRALDIISPWADNEIGCTIGGGEPTLNPHFWEIFGLLHSKYSSMWMATNGSQTETALQLAKLAEKGVLGVALSQDEWHDPIDPAVIKAFTRSNHNADDRRELREATMRTLMSQGRAKKIERESGKLLRHECCCEGAFLKPNGDIMRCGCAKSFRVGNVHDADITEKLESLTSDSDFFGYCGAKYGAEQVG